MPRITVRLQWRIDEDTRVGPGKIALLETIEATGSISAAARDIGMTYRRAWELIDQMNKALGRPVVRGHAGSTGGAVLTEFGRELARRYRDVEAALAASAAPHLAAIEALAAEAAAEGEEPAGTDPDPAADPAGAK